MSSKTILPQQQPRPQSPLTAHFARAFRRAARRPGLAHVLRLAWLKAFSAARQEVGK